MLFCLGHPCFPIYTPINGNKNCSGYRTEDSCDFDCLPGYDLTGSRTRTCGASKEWTGNDTECKSECTALLYFSYCTYSGSVQTVGSVYLYVTSC